MRVELHDSFRNPVSLPATRVVIYDEFDNPISLVVKVNEGHCLVAHAGDKEFKEILSSLGISKTLVIDTIKTKDMTPLK